MSSVHKEIVDNLTVTSLQLHSFRNYPNLSLDTIGNLTIFVGNNAVGKTSIIEALQLVTALASFRTTTASHLVAWNEQTASVDAHLEGANRSLKIKMVVDQEKRKYFLNGKSKRIQDLKGLLPAVTFTPDDLQLIKGSPSVRRNAVDALGGQLSKNFYVVCRDYQKLIKQKNQALKDDQPRVFVDSINEVLAKVGSQYIVHRLMLLGKMGGYINHYYRQIASGKEHVSLAYTFSWGEELLQGDFSSISKDEVKQQLTDALEHAYEQEQHACRSKVGPHADHIAFMLDGRNATHYASQGQQRSLVLAYKMAEAAAIQDIMFQRPILLLDDVMSELDEYRRGCFVDFIQKELQTFITTTNLGYFQDSIVRNAQVYRLPFE